MKFALNLLMNPEIDFVSLLGQAGTGKTLLTLAAALTQTLDERRYSEIIFTRATVSVGEEIGFLPGTEEEKMVPWMGALEDNLEVLNHTDASSGTWGHDTAQDIIRSRIRVKSMSFMRGRTFVCMGNIAQIDTPYLTEGSSGLTYVVDKFKGWAHAGHITLQRGERSRLADFASSVL
jgi:PhoH-like ATPase